MAAVMVLLLLAVAAVYGSSIGFEFVWDDGPLVVDNHRIKDPESIPALVASGFWETGDHHDRFRQFFRPLVSLTYAGDYALWGLKPAGYHLTNVALHWMVTLLVFAVARQEGLTRAASTIGALLFAVHPVHVENVAWISGRTDLLCALFMLGAFSLHRRGRLNGRRGAATFAPVLFFAALLSKEMAATLPILVFLSVLREPSRDRRRAWRAAGLAAAPFAIVLAIYLAIRTAVLGVASGDLLQLPLDEQIATAVFVVSRYVQMTLLPIGLDAHHPEGPVDGLLAPTAIVGAAMLLAALFFGRILARRDSRMGYWLAWFFVSLLPVLDFGSFGDVIMADRFLYIPSVAAALLAAHAARALSRAGSRRATRIVAAAACGSVLVVFSVVASEQTRPWSDNTTLFTKMVETSPDSAMVRSNLGYAHYMDGDYDAAKAELRQALRIAPGYALAHNKLGATLEREGRLAEAHRHYATALELAPDLLEASVNEARILTKFGRTDEALTMLDALTSRNERYVPGLYARADALERAGRENEALSLATRIIEIDRDFASAHYLVGKIRFESGDRAAAAASMRRFLELWPEEGLYREAALRVIALAGGSGGDGSDGQAL